MSASPKDFRLTAEQMAALNSLPADNTTGPEPGPPVAWGFVRGVPDRLVVVGNQGESAAFAVYDPEMLTTWFAPGLTPSA